MVAPLLLRGLSTVPGNFWNSKKFGATMCKNQMLYFFVHVVHVYMAIGYCRSLDSIDEAAGGIDPTLRPMNAPQVTLLKQALEVNYPSSGLKPNCAQARTTHCEVRSGGYLGRLSYSLEQDNIDGSR